MPKVTVDSVIQSLQPRNENEDSESETGSNSGSDSEGGEEVILI